MNNHRPACVYSPLFIGMESCCDSEHEQSLPVCTAQSYSFSTSALCGSVVMQLQMSISHSCFLLRWHWQKPCVLWRANWFMFEWTIQKKKDTQRWNTAGGMNHKQFAITAFSMCTNSRHRKTTTLRGLCVLSYILWSLVHTYTCIFKMECESVG